MAKIDEVFNEKYPQLAKQLEELGITDTDKLVERFQSNGKYLNEVLEYDLKDNEKIRSIAEEAPTEAPIREIDIASFDDEIEDVKGKTLIGIFWFVLFTIVVCFLYILFG